MRWRFLLLLTLALPTACSDTWGKGGIIDAAVEQDTRNSLRRRRPPPGCPMSLEQWTKKCDTGASDARAGCLDECVIDY